MAGAQRLSDFTVKAAQAGPKPRKLTDGDGLHLLVTPAGGKLWRFQYRHGGKQKLLTLGRYEDRGGKKSVGLKEARAAADKARGLLAQGKDPNDHRKAEVAAVEADKANTFNKLADEFLADVRKKRVDTGKLSAVTADKMEWLLGFARPDLGDLPISEITPLKVHDVLKVVEARGHLETARRLRATLSRAFQKPTLLGLLPANPCAPLKGLIEAPTVRSRSAITDRKLFGDLMRAAEGYHNPIIASSFKMLALTAARPSELRFATWSEFDLDEALWTVPATRMKLKVTHVVPLSRQALAVLKALREITGGGLVLPGLRGVKPISENTLNATLRRMGFGPEVHTAHGFRSTFSTMMNEAGGETDVIETCLAHKLPGGAIRNIYNRALYLDQRRAMLQQWADMIDTMRDGAEVVPLRRAGRGKAISQSAETK